MSSYQAKMPSYNLSDFFKKLPRRKTSTHGTAKLHDHSTAAGILAVSKSILALSPSQPPPSQESSVISTIYRNTSDTAQAFLPPIQAFADMIPGICGIIKGAIGGTLSVLQLVDVIRLHSQALLLMLNFATIEIHPEQRRLGEAHPQIAPASPPYR